MDFSSAATFFASSLARLEVFDSTDAPGKDIDVLDSPDVVQFEGVPQPCIDVCLHTPWCHGFVTVGDRCWFRGGLFTRDSLYGSASALAASKLPASADYTLYVLHRTDTTRAILAAGVGALIFTLLVGAIIHCCCCRAKKKVALVPTSPAKKEPTRPNVPKPSAARARELKKKMSFPGNGPRDAGNAREMV